VDVFRYIIEKGAFKVLKRDVDTGGETEVSVLIRGQCFGEVALIYDSTRCVCVCVLSVCA